MTKKAVLMSILVLIFTATAIVLLVQLTLKKQEPVYIGIAKYYDNRKAVVTITLDDFVQNTSAWQACLSTLTDNNLYYTIGVITNHSKIDVDWKFLQYWLDRGYAEIASHSRNHVHVPYDGRPDPYNNVPTVSYEWQINGSRHDIIGNLTLPKWQRCGEKEYVYVWIEPYGVSDEKVRRWLGDTLYLADRLAPSADIYNFAGWDAVNGLFHRVGYTIEMGNVPWPGGTTSVLLLNTKFDTAYNKGGIYHLVMHPELVSWEEGSYAYKHLAYISNRTDVWYVPFGLLYLYRLAYISDVIEVTSAGSGVDKVFTIEISENAHKNYGFSYPITYMFEILKTGRRYSSTTATRKAIHGVYCPVRAQRKFLTV